MNFLRIYVGFHKARTAMILLNAVRQMKVNEYMNKLK